MGKKLLEKASLVIAPRRPLLASTTATTRDTGTKPKTAIGAMAQFTDRQSAAIQEASRLKEQLREFEGSLPAKRLDPQKVVRSKWANRHELSFVDAEFEALKADILAQGGTVQPIKVRPLNDGSDRYEVIFGHRRHQACLELGLPVLALVEELDDTSLFVEMDRENRQRKDLRPYEVGLMYAKALDHGLFPSARKLAEAVGIDLSQLGKSLALARLPTDVLEAFASPLELQYRWVSDLVGAIQKDPERVLAVAKELQAHSPKLPAADIFKRLTEGGGTVPPPSSAKREEQLDGKAGQKGKLSYNARKRSIRIDLENIEPARFAEAKAMIAKFLA
ncbi:ParB/RepB/Spo0J family partition protein [Hydrogenophaga sp. OTU3427]|uniref:ParB/RepB/Spo0J family partition protein n=1 Tax=Hydrogenophaga sp. OTU3427 TaxID=3043856 RepID=UPI00313CD44B